MATHEIEPRRLLPDSRFNWVYPVDLVIGLIVTLFFLFYFNRVFGSLVAYAIRKYTWYKYRIYIDVQALQISFLAGRVFFKGFRYHGHNETILINDGYITWRYWLRRVREVGCISLLKHELGTDLSAQQNPGLEENAERKISNNLPCRIKAKIRGVEWFIYNRSPAYDSILENISPKQSSSNTTNDGPARKRARLNKSRYPGKEEHQQDIGSPTESSWSSQSEQVFQPTATKTTVSSRPQSGPSQTEQGSDLPLMLQILPIKVECSKGAIVMGNQHTRSILTANFDSATGLIDAQRASSSLDQYKQWIDLDFIHPVIQLKPNRAFSDGQLADAAKRDAASQDDKKTYIEPESRAPDRSLWSSLGGMLRRFGGSGTSFSHNRVRKPKASEKEGIPGEHRWLGLTRYMDDEDDLIEQERWKAVEYARFETIVDSPGISMSIHWDVAGPVPRRQASLPDTVGNDIDGDEPPDWSIDLRIRGGDIHYGPWADRQRTDLQNAFFPTLYKNAAPAPVIPPGEARISTVFKLVLEVEKATKLILHTREESKDWRWKGQPAGDHARDAKLKTKKHRGKKKEKANLSPEIRPYGWLDLQVMPDSTINFTMDLVARPNGYRNRVELDLRGPEMTSSVNHELLWRSKSQIISCDLSNPLEWSRLRQWYINIQSDALEVFLLRDHIFLLTDLISDWASGPSGDYYTFVPFKYLINLQLTNFRLYVNANDSNIINNPIDVNDNTFVVVWGEHLNADLTMPIEHYQPSRNAIPFDIDARDGGFELCTPQWNTQHSFLKDNGVASLNQLRINGSYNYASTTSPALTDILIMEVYGDSPKIHMYGFLIRYLMKIKDNYFGEDLHFRTLEEYKTQVAANERTGNANVDSNQHTKISNDLDVILKVSADNSCAVLPSGLYAAGQGITLDIASICGDLRFTNYYMDLGVTFSPISMAYAKSTMSENLPEEIESNTQVFIDGLNLYGHRLFGLPPTEPTYVCNWDFDVGSIRGECDPQFLQGLLLGVRCFGFSFDDIENALPPLNPPIIHDVTFLRVKVQPILVWLRTDSAAFQLGMQSVKLDYNDWATDQFSAKLSVQITDLVVAIVDDQGSPLDRANDDLQRTTQAYLQTTVNVRMLTRTKMFEQDRQLQQSHIRLQDVRTHRTPWLVHNIDQPALQAPSAPRTKIRPPAMQFPQMPEPLNYGHNVSSRSFSTSSISGRSRISSRLSSRKSSFLTDRNPRAGNTSQSALRLISSPENESFQHAHNSLRPPDVSHDPSPRKQRGSLTPQGITSSSPYHTPHFPLQNLKPILQDVPTPSTQGDEPNPLRRLGGVLVELPHQDQSIAKSTIMIDLAPGVRALCTPTALSHTLNLITELQLDTVESLLDDLQIDAMAETSLSTQTIDKRSENITELNIRIPSLQARFLTEPTGDTPSASNSSGLCLGIERLGINARLWKGAVTGQTGASSDQSSAHVSLDQIDLSLLSKFSKIPHIERQLSCTITDVVLWAAKRETSFAQFTSRDTDIVAINKGLSDVLPSAFQAMAALATMAEVQTKMTERGKIRFQLLVLSVILAGEEVPDPPFLTRASYVLRSANNHLRSSDSWKLMARLRYILQSLPTSMHTDIADRCLVQANGCPEGAGIRVAESLAHWRAWDASQVKQSLLMHKVYGPFGEPSEVREDVTTPVKGSVQGGSLRLTLLTNCGQNSIVIEKLEVALLHNQPAATTGGFIDPETFSVGDSVLQVHCARFATSLSWDLCELVDTALEISFDQLGSSPHDTSNSSLLIRKGKIHLVASCTISVIDFESVNFRSTFLCQGLKASTLLCRTASRQSINLIINADAATSEVESHSQVLTRWKLQRPNIYCCTDNDTHGAKNDQVWKVAASCSSVSFKTLQDPLIILEVVDLILKHEVSQAMKVAQDVGKRISQNQHSTPKPVEPAANKAHVTIFVDSYLLSLTILPTLIYRISGEGARTTIKHGLREASETLIDFELQGHLHAFRAQRDKTGDEIAAVHIPPIDCHLELKLGPQQRSVVLNTTIEAMKLEASALHTLLVTFSRPEMVDLPKSIDREIRLIQNSNQHLCGAADGDIQENPSESPILYDACIIAVGLSVFARSPLSSVNAREGHLDFSLGCVQAKATNRDGTSGVLLPFIEVDVRLNSIQAALDRVESAAKIPSGNIIVSAFFKSTSETSHTGEAIRALQLRINKFEISMYAETAPVIVDIIGHLQDTLKTIDLTSEFKSLKSIRRPKSRSAISTPLPEPSDSSDHDDSIPTSLFGAMYSLEMTNIRLSWIIGSSTPMSPGREAEDLVLSFSRIDLSTRRDNAARLLIENFQVQIVPGSKVSMGRSQNSALLPEVVFNVAYLSTGKDRRLAFQAAGKSLDLRLTSKFILPASDLRRSIAFAIQEVRTATADWKASAAEKGNQTRQLLGGKKFASILVDADFAGAVVYIEGRNIGDRQYPNLEDSGRVPQHGRYNQFTPDNSNSSTRLQSPGLAFKIEYRNGGADQESLNAEIKVDASNNTLHPTVVPLIMEISSSVKEMMGESSQLEQSPKAKSAPSKLIEDDRLRSADPSAVFGKMKVNFGLRICKQEFSLSCQPWAKVAATARFEDIYVTLNTIQSADHGQFFTVSTVFTKPALSVQHTYSREPTGSLNVDSVFVSLMSSKHVSAANGLSVILKISPMNLQVNARQLQDVLLFREIWIPQEIRHAPATPAPNPSTEPQAFVVQRYQQVAAASAFPWDAVVSVAQLNVQLDLGQSLGRSILNLSNFWVSSKKTSNSEQNLCLGFDRAGVDATGRMSGLIECQALRIRTSIQWPMEDSKRHTPLVQASLGFDHLRVKAAFDYQAFALMNITTVDFVMYNVRDPGQATGDRLVAVVEGDKAQIFCTAISASQGLALYQAIQRLIEEKQTAYETSLKDIERFLRRRSTINPTVLQTAIDKIPASEKEEGIKVPIRLQTNVLVRLHAVSFGIFPSTFFDNQIFKIEAKDASARFSVALQQGKVHSSLGMTLGQLRVALSGATRPSAPKKVGEVSIDEVAASATASRGGLILGVPKTVVGMQIWQIPESNHIDYIFRSSFEGNIDVGWNYSRISFIRGMHTSHVRALAQRLGKPLPQSALQIRGGLKQDGEDGGRASEGEQEKITAVVNVPQSKYDYTALQPALIDTPQLRNLGEATPPLEWIGLNRERLPNLTHQIVIVSLLEVAKEVEDAYTKILGSS